MYETILSPVNYGGLQLKNRIIFAPTTFGLPDEEYLAEIRRLAEGGCAMLIIGDVPVGKSKFEKSLFDAKGFAFYQQIVEIAHKADCKVCAQLHQSDSNMLAMLKYIPAVLAKKLTPDQLREKLNAEVEPYITKMPKRKIEAILAGFGKAAVLAKQAGFDMVQVHGDRMCGSFSSSIFNHRTDEYGGSAENRARFAVEAVKAVHAAVPEFPIDYKLAGLVQDLFVDGDLADVVQGRGQRDVLLHLGGDVVDVGAFEQFCEHPLGEAVDVLNVQPALAVAELHQLAQHPHQHGGVPLPRADLFGQ
jgi:2,4-dienoyl-CoA reductase (NADPH2)